VGAVSVGVVVVCRMGCRVPVPERLPAGPAPWWRRWAARPLTGWDHGQVIAITRYRVPDDETASFVESATTILAALEAYPGHHPGRLARAVDDPSLWALITDWDGAGFYRRALSVYEVRVIGIPLSRLAVDEPGAYETVVPAPERDPATVP
jgi:hypothetical protein